MSVSFNKKKKQRFVSESNRSNAVSHLSSEEELSDRRSSSSTESSFRRKDDTKSQRSARKASKKSWEETLGLLDCDFSSSSADEEWNKMIPNHNSSDSDLDWNPMQKTQSRSSGPPKLTNIVMKRTLSETAHSPAQLGEAHLKALDDGQLSSPPKLIAIDIQSKTCSLKPPHPPILKARPISFGGIEEQNLLEGQTSPIITEKEESTNVPYPPMLNLGKNVEATKEFQESLPSSKTYKLRATYKKTIKRSCNRQQGNLCHSPVNPTLKQASLYSNEDIPVSVASPGPPDLIPIFDKSKRDSPGPPSLPFVEEAQNLNTIDNEDQTSESSFVPPELEFKGNTPVSQKSLEPQILEEAIHSLSALEEDQAMAPSPGPPKLLTSVRQPKRRSQKFSQPPILEVEPMAILPKEDQQISVLSPPAPKLATNAKKSRMQSKKSTQPEILRESQVISNVSKDQTSRFSVTSLKPISTTCRKVERGSSKFPHLLPEDVVCIPMLSEKERISKSPLSTPPKPMAIARRKKSATECTPLPTLKSVPTLPTSDEDHLSMSSPSEPSIDCSLTFAGIISHNASLLEKGFDSGKFIMLKSDLKTQKSPSIWRIDGKNLLQKYESISYNNGIAYRNISTYSSWMASNKGLYVPIEVEFCVQSKSETIVTFDRNKVMLPVEDGMMEALNEEANSMIDTFQIYLQTLMSQALDSNFVKEIVKEQDDYFLTSIAAVEDHWILPKRNMLKEIIKMKRPFQELLETHPRVELRCVTSGDKSCDSCSGRNPTRSFEFQPLVYSFDTLDIMEGKLSNKTYRLCLACTDRILLYHELFHMRYYLFICCQKKVNQYDQKDGPAALTSSLADQTWKSLMHRRVLLVLAETQQVISQHSADACVV